MKTLVSSPFENDAEELLGWAYGEHVRYEMRDRVIMGQRVGQAFMNTLYLVDRDSYYRIAQSVVNPTHQDKFVPAALDLMTTK